MFASHEALLRQRDAARDEVRVEIELVCAREELLDVLPRELLAAREVHLDDSACPRGGSSTRCRYDAERRLLYEPAFA